MMDDGNWAATLLYEYPQQFGGPSIRWPAKMREAGGAKSSKNPNQGTTSELRSNGSRRQCCLGICYYILSRRMAKTRCIPGSVTNLPLPLPLPSLLPTLMVDEYRRRVAGRPGRHSTFIHTGIFLSMMTRREPLQGSYVCRLSNISPLVLELKPPI